MRILHTESSIGWGGQELRILTEAQGMLARGHEVTLLTPESADIYPAAAARNIPVVTLPIEKKRLHALLAVRRWLAAHRGRFDVINTHSSTDSWLVALARATLGGMPPVVRTRHVSTAVHKDRATRWLYQTACAHIVTAGEALRAQLATRNHFALESMTSVPTGIDLERFRPMDRRAARREAGLDERLALGIVATLRDWKGHDYVLDAWARLAPRFADWQLVVIGEGPQRARLETRVAAEGLAASVRFVGNQDNVPVWLNSLDLFTLPSFGDEGVPQAIMQAMACGLAVVATPVGAIEEAVQRGRTGLIVPPRDATALAAALGALMGDPARRTAMGRAGREYAVAHFGIERMLDGMEAVFRRVIERA
ncbi:MAG TPA: glycosyltransferase family 4 protein [Burkholderiales bacterium]|nr:glycosyltransferase family 4 protein [Burkholderiales bacterium]